jgi:hypothetical protein
MYCGKAGSCIHLVEAVSIASIKPVISSIHQWTTLGQASWPHQLAQRVPLE